MTLYIYRVGWTYPARNPNTDLNLQKVLVVVGFQLDRSDRRFAESEIGSTGQTAYGHRSDRSANFHHQQMAIRYNMLLISYPYYPHLYKYVETAAASNT